MDQPYRLKSATVVVRKRKLWGIASSSDKTSQRYAAEEWKYDHVSKTSLASFLCRISMVCISTGPDVIRSGTFIILAPTVPQPPGLVLEEECGRSDVVSLAAECQDWAKLPCMRMDVLMGVPTRTGTFVLLFHLHHHRHHFTMEWLESMSRMAQDKQDGDEDMVDEEDFYGHGQGANAAAATSLPDALPGAAQFDGGMVISCPAFTSLGVADFCTGRSPTPSRPSQTPISEAPVM